MDLVPIKMELGEERAWEALSKLPPGDVCTAAAAAYDEASGLYRLRSFGKDFSVSVREKRIFSDSPGCEALLDTMKDLFRISLLSYLTSAKDIPLSGRLIKPSDVKGGQRFFGGTYQLPLQQIADKYGNDAEGFVKRGTAFGGERDRFGDASLRILPLPRVPILLILWLLDEEFPPRADILFDSTVDLQIPLSDVVWAVAAMTLALMR